MREGFSETTQDKVNRGKEFCLIFNGSVSFHTKLY